MQEIMSSKRSGLIRYQKWLNFAIGAGDGLIVPLAVMGAVIPFAESKETVSFIGFVIVAIGSLVMAAGGYFTNKSTVEGLKKEAEYIAKSEAILHHIDMSEYIGSEIPDPHEAEAEAKLQEMQKEFSEDPEAEKLPVHAAIQVGFAYLLAGVLILLSFYFGNDIIRSFIYSGILSIAGLLIIAYIKSRYNGISFAGNTFRLLLIAAIAIPGPFLVAKFLVNG